MDRIQKRKKALLFGFAALILSGELALDVLIPASVHDTAEAWLQMLRKRLSEHPQCGSVTPT